MITDEAICMATRSVFVDSMTIEEKQALLGALGFMARVDGRLSNEEIAFIRASAAIFELDAEPVLVDDPARSLATILEPVIEEKSQRAIVLELVRLAHADQCFSLDELVVIEEIATVIFGLDARTLEAIKDWVVREEEAQRAAFTLIEYGA
jgi:uncharacterized tellurite resistance protein B-like protein